MPRFLPVILTAFRNSSSELLIKKAERYQTLLLPNHKVKDSEVLIKAIQQEKPEYVFSFGQRPNIKDKVHIETTAKEKEFSIDTNFDCEKLRELFEQNGIATKISHNAGTSFCNQLYLNGLKYIVPNNLNTKMVFIHIPYEKNISDKDVFFGKILNAINRI